MWPQDFFIFLYLHTHVYTDVHGTFSSLEIALKDKPDHWRSMNGKMKCVEIEHGIHTDEFSLFIRKTHGEINQNK